MKTLDNMTTTKGMLKIGLEYAGKTHVEFTMRAPKVKDTIEATVEVGEGNSLKFMLATYSKQLISLGEIPKEHITADLLSDLYDIDLAVIQEASQDLEKKVDEREAGLKLFRQAVLLLVKNGFTKTDIDEMSKPEMTAYINLIINAVDKKPDNSSSGNVKRWVSTKRKNGRKSDTIT